jgi:hypothetical protein
MRQECKVSCKPTVSQDVLESSMHLFWRGKLPAVRRLLNFMSVRGLLNNPLKQLIFVETIGNLKCQRNVMKKKSEFVLKNPSLMRHRSTITVVVC